MKKLIYFFFLNQKKEINNLINSLYNILNNKTNNLTYPFF